MAYSQCFTKNPTVRVTAGYPNYPDGEVHGAADTVLSPDTSIYAPAAGTIIRAWVWQGTVTGTDQLGNHVLVQMGPAEYWIAGHMASQECHVGQKLNAGDYVGKQGATGNVTGPHVHWEHRVGGQTSNYRVDPFPLLGIPNALGTYQVVWSGEGGGNTPGEDSELLFTPTPGTYTLPIDVTMFTSISGAEIYWTDNGIYPSLTSNKYTGPVHIGKGDTQFIAAVYVPAEEKWYPWTAVRYKILEDDTPEAKKKKTMPLYMMLYYQP